ncbi:hypothetical protein QYF36_004930 [Acer negundo]|nr:hypothetical protein QYF36_004930 [Acer negundo]
MGKSTYKKLKGSQNLRQRLVLSTLAFTPFLIEEICPEDTWSGLRPHEVWLLRLVEKVCNDCIVEINKTGITNDSKDPCVDTFRSTTLPILKRFRVPFEGFELKIESCGSPPYGEVGEIEDEEKRVLTPLKDVGKQIASFLLEQVDHSIPLSLSDIAASLTRAPLHLSLFRGSACTRQSSREFN